MSDFVREILFYVGIAVVILLAWSALWGFTYLWLSQGRT
jgi:hypothetical protein